MIIACVSVCVLCRRGCGRKRKGTPVKVFVTHTEEESVPEHSFNPGVCLCAACHILTAINNVCVCLCVIGVGVEHVQVTVTYFCACVYMCVCARLCMCCNVHLCVCSRRWGDDLCVCSCVCVPAYLCVILLYWLFLCSQVIVRRQQRINGPHWMGLSTTQSLCLTTGEWTVVCVFFLLL